MPNRRRILLQPGEILYREGGPNDCAYLIEEGEVILYSSLLGERVDCERRGAGSIIGELSILTGQPRAVTVEAVEPCKIFVISAEQILARFNKLDPVLRACVETSINFSTTFSEQLRQYGQDVPFAPSTLRNADDLIQEFRLESDIYRGLAEGEFHLAYQPIVSLSEQRIVGVEALMRWQHGQMGLIPPGRFIELAERMGSIDRITEFALSEACAALTRMREASGDDVFMSVNISGQDLARDGFTDFMGLLLDQYSLPEGALKLEVTETALVANSDQVAGHLKRLRASGCGISVDDFGTGYSNLAYLKVLPLSTLKIDRSFAGDAHENEVSRSIVSMLVGLGNDLGVDIVAEGLETAEAVEAVRSLGCDLAQGYYFSKPAAEAEIVRMLTRSASARSVA